MMELYGLIAKLSSTSDNKEEQTYFVPTQLNSPPSVLNEIMPSFGDPCPIFLHFLDGFVPHGLFPQFLSRCITWCSENGITTPQLFNNGARFFLGKPFDFNLILLCRKRFIKVILQRRTPSPLESPSYSSSDKMAVEVRNFIETTLDGLSHDLCWLRNLRYELSVACTYCLQSSAAGSLHGLESCDPDDCLCLLRVTPWEELICPKNFSGESIKVPGLDRWFEHQRFEVNAFSLRVGSINRLFAHVSNLSRERRLVKLNLG